MGNLVMRTHLWRKTLLPNQLCFVFFYSSYNALTFKNILGANLFLERSPHQVKKLAFFVICINAILNFKFLRFSRLSPRKAPSKTCTCTCPKPATLSYFCRSCRRRCALYWCSLHTDSLTFASTFVLFSGCRPKRSPLHPQTVRRATHFHNSLSINASTNQMLSQEGTSTAVGRWLTTRSPALHHLDPHPGHII